jgi:acetyl-CoA synthetase (ADP-forming)
VTVPAERPAFRIGIEHVLNPRSVAVIGASEDPAKFGGRVLRNVVRHGFAGALLPVNPNRSTLLGLPAYTAIGAAPGPVDVAVIAVPAASLLDTVAACAAAGVGAAIVFTAQLGEFDAAGLVLQDKITAVARAAGMRLVGPNCMGMISPAGGLALSSTPTLQHVEALRSGPVAFISQSGALMGALFILGHDHSVGFSHMVTVGNQADMELCDFLEGVIEDGRAKIVCLYVEAVKSPARFMSLARRARAAGLRVLAVKAGRTEAGSALARSHTASLAGSFEAFEAVCRATGVLLVDEPEAMILAAGVLARCGPAGPGGVGLVVSSGGGGAVTADRMTVAGLPLAAWSAATRDRLGQHFLPAHINNPMDLGAHFGVLEPGVFADTIAAVADDPGVAVVMYIMTPQPLMEQTADALARAWRDTGKPFVVVMDTASFAAPIRARLTAAGMPYVSRIDDGLRTVDLLLRERGLRDDAAARDAPRPPGAGPASSLPGQGALTETQAKSLFTAYGIACPTEATVRAADAAVVAAAAIGYPVVVKGVTATVVHKSDAGLVRLGLTDATAVRAAFAAVAANLPEASPTIVVQAMIQGEAELIVGVRRDAAFGPQILVGFGGILVELLRDVSIECAPVSPALAEAMLRRLTMWPVLAGVRGRPALDVPAVADIVSRLSWLAVDLGERLEDLEINPVIVRAAGQGAVAVDGTGTLSGVAS